MAAPPLLSSLPWLLLLPFLLLQWLLLSVHPAQAVGRVVSMANTNWDYNYPYQREKIGSRKWRYGSATFYSYIGGSSGACGYPWAFVNKVDTAAVPDPRFSDYLTVGLRGFVGAACGQCYFLKCLEVPRYGRTVFCRTSKAVKVRVTDYDVPGSWGDGKWPNNHFDLKPSTFAKLAHPVAGIINIKWRRAYCGATSVKWALSSGSNPFWKDVIIFMAPSVGSVHKIWIKPADRRKWYKGHRLWGSHFTFFGGYSVDSKTHVLVFLAEGKGALYAKRHQVY